MQYWKRRGVSVWLAKTGFRLTLHSTWPILIPLPQLLTTSQWSDSSLPLVDLIQPGSIEYRPTPSVIFARPPKAARYPYQSTMFRVRSLLWLGYLSPISDTMAKGVASHQNGIYDDFRKGLPRSPVVLDANRFLGIGGTALGKHYRCNEVSTVPPRSWKLETGLYRL